MAFNPNIESVSTNIGGFVKTVYSSSLVIYKGINLSISIKDDNYIEFMSDHFHHLLAKLTAKQRHKLVTDFTGLADKRGQATPQAYVEFLINNGDLNPQ